MTDENPASGSGITHKNDDQQFYIVQRDVSESIALTPLAERNNQSYYPTSQVVVLEILENTVKLGVYVPTGFQLQQIPKLNKDALQTIEQDISPKDFSTPPEPSRYTLFELCDDLEQLLTMYHFIFQALQQILRSDLYEFPDDSSVGLLNILETIYQHEEELMERLNMLREQARL